MIIIFILLIIMTVLAYISMLETEEEVDDALKATSLEEERRKANEDRHGKTV